MPSLVPEERLVNYHVELDSEFDEYRVILKPRTFLDALGNPKFYGKPNPLNQLHPQPTKTIENGSGFKTRDQKLNTLSWRHNTQESSDHKSSREENTNAKESTYLNVLENEHQNAVKGIEIHDNIGGAIIKDQGKAYDKENGVTPRATSSTIPDQIIDSKTPQDLQPCLLPLPTKHVLSKLPQDLDDTPLPTMKLTPLAATGIITSLVAPKVGNPTEGSISASPSIVHEQKPSSKDLSNGQNSTSSMFSHLSTKGKNAKKGKAKKKAKAGKQVVEKVPQGAEIQNSVSLIAPSEDTAPTFKFTQSIRVPQLRDLPPLSDDPEQVAEILTNERLSGGTIEPIDIGKKVAMPIVVDDTSNLAIESKKAQECAQSSKSQSSPPHSPIQQIPSISNPEKEGPVSTSSTSPTSIQSGLEDKCSDLSGSQSTPPTSIASRSENKSSHSRGSSSSTLPESSFLTAKTSDHVNKSNSGPDAFLLARTAKSKKGKASKKAKAKAKANKAAKALVAKEIATNNMGLAQEWIDPKSLSVEPEQHASSPSDAVHATEVVEAQPDIVANGFQTVLNEDKVILDSVTAIEDGPVEVDKVLDSAVPNADYGHGNFQELPRPFGRSGLAETAVLTPPEYSPKLDHGLTNNTSGVDDHERGEASSDLAADDVPVDDVDITAGSSSTMSAAFDIPATAELCDPNSTLQFTEDIELLHTSPSGEKYQQHEVATLNAAIKATTDDTVKVASGPLVKPEPEMEVSTMTDLCNITSAMPSAKDTQSLQYVHSVDSKAEALKHASRVSGPDKPKAAVVDAPARISSPNNSDAAVMNKYLPRPLGRSRDISDTSTRAKKTPPNRPLIRNGCIPFNFSTPTKAPPVLLRPSASAHEWKKSLSEAYDNKRIAREQSGKSGEPQNNSATVAVDEGESAARDCSWTVITVPVMHEDGRLMVEAPWIASKVDNSILTKNVNPKNDLLENGVLSKKQENSTEKDILNSVILQELRGVKHAIENLAHDNTKIITSVDPTPPSKNSSLLVVDRSPAFEIPSYILQVGEHSRITEKMKASLFGSLPMKGLNMNLELPASVYSTISTVATTSPHVNPLQVVQYRKRFIFPPRDTPLIREKTNTVDLGDTNVNEVGGKVECSASVDKVFIIADEVPAAINKTSMTINESGSTVNQAPTTVDEASIMVAPSPSVDGTYSQSFDQRQHFYNLNHLIGDGEISWVFQKLRATASGDVDYTELKEKTGSTPAMTDLTLSMEPIQSHPLTTIVSRNIDSFEMDEKTTTKASAEVYAYNLELSPEEKGSDFETWYFSESSRLYDDIVEDLEENAEEDLLLDEKMDESTMVNDEDVVDTTTEDPGQQTVRPDTKIDISTTINNGVSNPAIEESTPRPEPASRPNHHIDSPKPLTKKIPLHDMLIESVQQELTTPPNLPQPPVATPPPQPQKDSPIPTTESTSNRPHAPPPAEPNPASTIGTIFDAEKIVEVATKVPRNREDRFMLAELIVLLVVRFVGGFIF